VGFVLVGRTPVFRTRQRLIANVVLALLAGLQIARGLGVFAGP
jgi:hypothetical protein